MLVARHPRRIWAITVVGLAIACLFVPTLKASGTAQTDVFLTEVDSIAGQQALTDHFPGGSGNPVVIIAPEAAAEQVVSTVAGVEGISGEPTVVTAAGAGPQAAGAPPLVVDGEVQIQATLERGRRRRGRGEHRPRGPGRGACHSRVRRADPGRRQHRHPDRHRGHLGPRPAGDHPGRSWVAVLLVLILLLRSLIAALLLVFATVLSFGAALGVSALVFNHVFDFPGADPAVPLFAFVFLVALGIDYSIFLMTRAREEVAFYGPHDGVMRGLRLTGGVITSAGRRAGRDVRRAGRASRSCSWRRSPSSWRSACCWTPSSCAPCWCRRWRSTWVGSPGGRSGPSRPSTSSSTAGRRRFPTRV